MQQFERYRATIRLRRDGHFIVKSEVEEWDGREIEISVAWPIKDSAIYGDDEWACFVTGDNARSFPSAWIASGDLANLALASDNSEIHIDGDSDSWGKEAAHGACSL